MTPEEMKEEKKELEEDKKIYPPFLVEEFRKGREESRIEAKTGKSIPYNPTKITDFLSLIICIWKISNKGYQERFWVRQEVPIQCDNYMETLETFLGDARAALDTSDYAVEMTNKQYRMIQKLYDMIEAFEDDPDTPDDPGYGVNDAAIINDPKWEKIRQYAKLVYEELSGDDLDAWEKYQPKQAKPLEIVRKKMTLEEFNAEKEKIYPRYLLKCEQRAMDNDSLYNRLVGLSFGVWEMSNQDFQERFWSRKEYPIYDDKNCTNTIWEIFDYIETLMMTEQYLTPKQRELLQKLYDMVKDFENDSSKPENPGYGINDAEIIAHPKWEKIRQYAKIVYEALSDPEETSEYEKQMKEQWKKYDEDKR